MVSMVEGVRCEPFAQSTLAWAVLAIFVHLPHMETMSRQNGRRWASLLTYAVSGEVSPMNLYRV
jgi:hypothetical protein